MKIYTRTGDGGMTSLRGGRRVPKTDCRIAANGALDELNSSLGVAGAFIEDEDIEYKLKNIQKTLMLLMSIIADIPTDNPRRLPENSIDELECEIDNIKDRLDSRTIFVIPGGVKGAALLQMSRAIARRAEREIWHLNEAFPLDPFLLRYVNRLSDYLYSLARYVNE